MKKSIKLVTAAATAMMLGGAIIPSTTALADSVGYRDTMTNHEEANANLEESSIIVDENNLIVTHYEGKARANVYKWGGWSYTHIAVSTGVTANAVNAALYGGVGSVIGIFGGLPTWAISGLLTSASWTKLGSKPGAAVAKKWDKNKNGWVGFYARWGYDAAGRKVASQYTTE